MPKFQMFDGSGDPFNHMMNFRQVMTLQCKNDPLLCKVFPLCLNEPVLAWFHQLPLGSVASFHKLLDSFATKYLCSIRKKRSIVYLFKIKTERGESQCRAPEPDPTVNRIRRREPHETICQNTFYIIILIYKSMISLLIHSLI